MYTLKKIEGYCSSMSLRDTEKAIKLAKDTFETIFAKKLGLERISAPMFVQTNSGVNDDLNGVERSVKFDIKEIDDENKNAEIVHSLAKWKRIALANYGFNSGEGMYTDMNAIRRDDSLDNIHSIYVDQWDWEKVISREDRTIDFLKKTVDNIVLAITDTLAVIKKSFPTITTDMTSKVFYLTSQELEDMYPSLNSKQREFEITKKYRTVFLMQIGDVLKGGERHDGRAPDYDDWKLNGDLLFFDDLLGEQVEISSMGIRVDADSLKSQLTKADKIDRMKYSYHQKISNNELPLTIGGGIGQSRLCLLMLQKLHIGEVQVSIWPKQMLEECKDAGIEIL